MENSNGYGGNINPNDVATLALLGRSGGYGGYGGYGGGSGNMYAGNQVLAAEAHANGTALKEAVDNNGKVAVGAIANMGQAFESGARQQQFFELSTEHTALERRINDQNAASIATLNDVRAESAKCCCENKLIAAENKSELLAAIAALESRTVARELDAANAKITQLETINALKRHH